GTPGEIGDGHGDAGRADGERRAVVVTVDAVVVAVQAHPARVLEGEDAALESQRVGVGRQESCGAAGRGAAGLHEGGTRIVLIDDQRAAHGPGGQADQGRIRRAVAGRGRVVEVQRGRVECLAERYGEPRRRRHEGGDDQAAHGDGRTGPGD